VLLLPDVLGVRAQKIGGLTHFKRKKPKKWKGGTYFKREKAKKNVQGVCTSKEKTAQKWRGCIYFFEKSRFVYFLPPKSPTYHFFSNFHLLNLFISRNFFSSLFSPSFIKYFFSKVPYSYYNLFPSFGHTFECYGIVCFAMKVSHGISIRL
jgi:hypothetical protein